MKSNRFLITPFVSILYPELEFSFVRSSGPGGQNVNKVNSKAVLRWCLSESQSLTPELKERLQQKLSDQLNSEGCLLFTSDESRDQGQNRERCLEKLKTLLGNALFVPKKRKATKMSHSRKRKNEVSKRLHSEKKRMRKSDF